MTARRLPWQPDEHDGWTLDIGILTLEISAERDDTPPHYGWIIVGRNDTEAAGYGDTREDCERQAVYAARGILQRALEQLRGVSP